MSSILSSLPLYSSSVNGASALSSDQLLLNQLTAQQNQNGTSDVFGSAVSLNLSDAALSALDGDSSVGSDSTAGILNALTYSNYSTNSQGGGGYSIDAMLGDLENIGSGTQSPQDMSAITDPFATDSTSFAEAALADGGPLPAFLAQVDTQLNLNVTQQQALQNIASENMNATNTPATIQQIAGELQQAGI